MDPTVYCLPTQEAQTSPTSGPSIRPPSAYIQRRRVLESRSSCPPIALLAALPPRTPSPTPRPHYLRPTAPQRRNLRDRCVPFKPTPLAETPQPTRLLPRVSSCGSQSLPDPSLRPRGLAGSKRHLLEARDEALRAPSRRPSERKELGHALDHRVTEVAHVCRSRHQGVPVPARVARQLHRREARQA